MKFAFLGFMTAFFSNDMYAQLKDSLMLDIKGLNKPAVILKYLGKPNIILTEDVKTIPTKSDSTVFIISSSPLQNAYVLLITQEGDKKDTVKLEDINKDYLIKKGILLDPRITLKGTINIEIFNARIDTPIKKFPIKFGGAGSRNITDEDISDASSYKVGSLIHDALFLAKGQNAAIQYKILSYYDNGESNMDKLRDDYSVNKFLDSLVRTIVTKGMDQGAGGLSSFFSSIGGLDVTSFADGAAKFIVKRAKQELSIAFFQKFKKVIEETRDIATVFPQTANILDAIDDQIYDYEKYLQNLREAFKKDLKEIHWNLPGIVDNHPVLFNRHPEVKASLLTACYTAQELEKQSHPGDILANYPIEFLDEIENKNYKGAIQTIQAFSASLRDTVNQEDASYWVNIRQIRELVNDKRALKFYLGLLYQEVKHKYDNIQFEGTTLITLLDAVAMRYEKTSLIYNSYRNYVLRFGEKVGALNKMIKDYSKENPADTSIFEKYAKYFKTSVELVEYCTEAFKLPGIKEHPHFQDLPSLLKKYFEVAYSAADLAVAANGRQYSSALNHALHIYNLVAVQPAPQIRMVLNPSQERNEKRALKRFNKSMEEVEKITDDRFSEDLKKTITKELTDDSTGQSHLIPSVYDTTKRTLKHLVRYGSFIASVATAKNSDEVERAIEAAALPVGSSRIKRVSDFNVALNSYAGLFYGVERINDLDSGKWKPNVYGVTAPIGVSISWGHRFLVFPSKKEWSTSIYISLIDLGAVAAFRFTDDSTSQVPTIKFENIFSPGAFLSLGIPKTPLSFNIGAQMGPNLRKVNADASKGNDFSDKIYWRFSTSIVVDIPIVNFYTKSK